MSGTKNVGASVRARLLKRARADKVEFNQMLTRYALERLLYRLGVSTWSVQFLLKGALLFDLWFDHPQRPTRDIDLLGFGPAEVDHLKAVFQDICRQSCDDGMAYEPASVRTVHIRKDANYGGVRVTLLGVLDGAHCSVQVDVGYGDAVTPAADKVRFPVVLDDMPQPTLRAYPVHTVVAEKYQAIVSLGIANTRMKDYFDLFSRDMTRRFVREWLASHPGGEVIERDLMDAGLRFVDAAWLQACVIGIVDLTFVAGGGAKAVDLGEETMAGFVEKLGGELERAASV
jgi:hypothetical protein